VRFGLLEDPKEERERDETYPNTKRPDIGQNQELHYKTEKQIDCRIAE